jgi:tRNA U38,U39,U40 pseudouridine synthase TruA
MSYPETIFPGPVFTGTAKTEEDETIQSTLLKIIERADAKSVTEIDGVSNLPS